MLILKQSELRSGAKRCRKAMHSKSITQTSSPVIDKVVFIKQTIRSLMTGAMKLEDLEDAVRIAFQDFGWRNHVQSNYQAGDAYKQIRRYVGAEQKLGRKPYFPAAKTVTLRRGINATVRVDVMFWQNGHDADGKPMTFVEAVLYKCGKPNMTQRTVDRGGRDALELYAVLKYLRTFVKPDEDMHLKASIYWLRKNSDKHAGLDGATKEVFSDDFFDLKAAGNIVSLEETWRSGKLENNPKQDWDSVFKPACIAFAKGLDETECTEKDCDACPYKSACKYTTPVMHVNTATTSRHLADLSLTEAQEEVTMITQGFHRVNAGAGSGKTLVVSLLIATLIADGADPSKILAITFTVSAADELRERVRLYVEDYGCDPKEADKIRIMTFNAFGYECIKKDYAKLGFTAEPKVIDSVENFRIIANLLNSRPEIKGLDYRNFTMDMGYAKGALVVVADIFDVIKQENLGVGDEGEIASCLRKEKGYYVREAVIEEVVKLYDEYDQHLRSENLIRFDDQLAMVKELLYQDPFYFEPFGFEHILIDEFQDTDARQLDLVKTMCKAPSFKSLTVVGDDSQSIYGFRHTSPEFIIHFDEHMADLGVVEDHYLLNNYRSQEKIVNFANTINGMNVNRVAKDLIPTRAAGEDVHVIPNFDADKKLEMKYIVDRIEKYVKAGVSLEDIAVICFKKAELTIIGAMLAERGIQAVMMSPQKITENSRVLASISMLKALRDRTDEKSMFTYASALVDGGLVGKPEKEADEAIENARTRLDAILACPTDAAQKAKIIEAIWELDRNEDEVFGGFVNTLEFKPTVEKIYEYADDVKDFGEKSEIRCSHKYPGVVLTTAHSSKGLEWPIVFNLITSYDNESVHDNLDRVEEMRRLLFVTATRARDVLYIVGNAVAYKQKSEDGKLTKVVYNRFLMNSLTALGGKKFTSDDMAKIKAAYDSAKASLKKAAAKTAKTAKPKKTTKKTAAKKSSTKKASSKAETTEPSATQVVHTVRPARKLSGMTKWAKMRCKKHGRKSVRKGGRR